MKLPVHEILRRRDALQPLVFRRTRQAGDAEPHEFADEVFTDHDVIPRVSSVYTDQDP